MLSAVAFQPQPISPSTVGLIAEGRKMYANTDAMAWPARHGSQKNRWSRAGHADACCFIVNAGYIAPLPQEGWPSG